MKSEEIGQLAIGIPCRGMQRIEIFRTLRTYLFGVLQATHGIFRHRETFDSSIMYFALSTVSLKQSKKSVQSGAETYLKYTRRHGRTMIQPSTDKYMF